MQWPDFHETSSHHDVHVGDGFIFPCLACPIRVSIRRLPTILKDGSTFASYRVSYHLGKGDDARPRRAARLTTKTTSRPLTMASFRRAESRIVHGVRSLVGEAREIHLRKGRVLSALAFSYARHPHFQAVRRTPYYLTHASRGQGSTDVGTAKPRTEILFTARPPSPDQGSTVFFILALGRFVSHSPERDVIAEVFRTSSLCEKCRCAVPAC